MKTLYIEKVSQDNPSLSILEFDCDTYVDSLPSVDTLKDTDSHIWLKWTGDLADLLKILKPLSEVEKFWERIEFVVNPVTVHLFLGQTYSDERKPSSNQGYLVYHDNCLDGFLSAAVAVMYGELTTISNKTPIVVPSNYSDEPIKVTEFGSFIQIVDFSYDMSVLNDYINRGISVYVIDHHKSFVDSFIRYRENDKVSSGDRNFGSAFFSRLFINFTSDDQPLASMKITVSDNSHPDKAQIDSGASLTLKTIKSNPRFQDSQSAISLEVSETVRLAREHDLWFHKGNEMAPSYALSHWFKKFSKRHSARRELMLKFPDISFVLFAEMVEEFFSTSVNQKVQEALEELRVMRERIQTLTSSDAVCEVKLNVPDHNDIKVLYISSPEVNEIGISIIGSYMVREMGADVAVMDAVKNDNEHVYSLRSNSEGRSIDVSAICRHFKDNGQSNSGGGHRNAAGVAFSKQNAHLLFQPTAVLS